MTSTFIATATTPAGVRAELDAWIARRVGEEGGIWLRAGNVEAEWQGALGSPDCEAAIGSFFDQTSGILRRSEE